MLEIKNIQRMIGMSCHGREVSYAGDYLDRTGINKGSYYVFRFGAIGDGLEYNREQDIVLRREKNQNGKYELFCMGLQVRTEIELEKWHFANPIILAEQIRDVMSMTQKWYNKI